MFQGASRLATGKILEEAHDLLLSSYLALTPSPPAIIASSLPLSQFFFSLCSRYGREKGENKTTAKQAWKSSNIFFLLSTTFSFRKSWRAYTVYRVRFPLVLSLSLIFSPLFCLGLSSQTPPPPSPSECVPHNPVSHPRYVRMTGCGTHAFRLRVSLRVRRPCEASSRHFMAPAPPPPITSSIVAFSYQYMIVLYCRCTPPWRSS